MARPELLAVEIGRLHHVVINQQQILHPATCQHERRIGAQAAGPGQAHARGAQPGQLFRSEIAGQTPAQAVDHGCFLIALCGEAS